MLRTVFLCAVLLVSFCASAQGATDTSTSGPLKPRPVARKPVAQPPKQVAKARQKKPAPAATPVIKQAAPQPLDVAPVATIPTPRAPVTAEKAPEKAAVGEPVPRAPEPRPPFDEYVVTQFCTALSSAASDGRLAWQARRLDEMEARLRDRVAELEAKRAETADWLKRREEAQRKADESVVAIYAKMKPDAAAAQFSAMDESGAAAILAKLNPRAASTILNEIDAGRAARIAAEMAGLGPRRETARAAP